MQIGILIACAALLAAAPAKAADGTTRTQNSKAGRPGDPAAIEKLRTEWIAAWNQHQPEGLAAVFAESGDMINPRGKAARGHDQLVKLFQQEHADRLKNSTYSSTCEAPRFLADDVAVVDCAFKVEGVKGAGGSYAVNGHSTSVDVRTGDGWKVASWRAMAPRQEAPEENAAGRAPPPR